MAFCVKCGKELQGEFCSGCGTRVGDVEKKTEIQQVDMRGTIEALYSLRAGLSLVAMESDKAENEKALVQQAVLGAEEERDKLTEKLEKCQEIKNEKEESVRDKNRQIERDNKDWLASLEKHKKTIKEFKSKMISVIIWAGIFLISGLIGLVVFLVDKNKQDVAAGFAILAVYGLGGVLIACIVVLVNHLKDYLRAKEALKCSKGGTGKVQLISISEECEKDEEYKDAVAQIEKYNREIPALYEKHEVDKKSNAAIGKIAEYVKEGNRIYKALEEEYSQMLDPRDWESIDFIIYILETRRADSFKEALQQLDLHKNTDKIVRAIKDANTAICMKITQEIGKLGTAMVTCANAINSRLEGIMVSQEKVARGIENSIESSHLQNALLEKSVVSSNELLKSVNEITNYASNTERISHDIRAIKNQSGYIY